MVSAYIPCPAILLHRVIILGRNIAPTKDVDKLTAFAFLTGRRKNILRFFDSALTYDVGHIYLADFCCLLNDLTVSRLAACQR